MEQQSREAEEPQRKEEIPLDNKIAQGFARLLEQEVFKDSSELILSAAKDNPRENEISAAVSDIQNALASLHKKQSTLTREPRSEWGVEFSDQEVEEAITEEEVPIEKDLYEKIRAALWDKLNSPFQRITLLSEMIGNRDIEEKGHEISERFKSLIRPLMPREQVRLITNSEGKTTLDIKKPN